MENRTENEKDSKMEAGSMEGLIGLITNILTPRSLYNCGMGYLK